MSGGAYSGGSGLPGSANPGVRYSSASGFRSGNARTLSCGAQRSASHASGCHLPRTRRVPSGPTPVSRALRGTSPGAPFAAPRYSPQPRQAPLSGAVSASSELIADHGAVTSESGVGSARQRASRFSVRGVGGGAHGPTDAPIRSQHEQQQEEAQPDDPAGKCSHRPDGPSRFGLPPGHPEPEHGGRDEECHGEAHNAGGRRHKPDPGVIRAEGAAEADPLNTASPRPTWEAA